MNWNVDVMAAETSSGQYGVSCWSSMSRGLAGRHPCQPAALFVKMGDQDDEIDNFASFWLEEPLPDVLDILQDAPADVGAEAPMKSEPQGHAVQEVTAQRPRRGNSKYTGALEPEDQADVVRSTSCVSQSLRQLVYCASSGGESLRCESDKIVIASISCCSWTIVQEAP